MRKILIAVVCFLTFAPTFAQETRSYTSESEQYLKAVSLFQGKHYASSYKAFSDYIKATDQDLSVIPTEEQINAKLYQALSARFAGKNNSIKLIKHFLSDYPSHPNTSLARLELGKHYFENRDFNLALENLQKVDAGALEPDQLDDYNMSLGYTYFVKKQFNRAVSYLRPLTQRQTAFTVPANYYLGLSYYFLEEYDKALANFGRADKDPRYYPVIPYYVAKIFFSQERYEDVIKFVEPMLSEDLSYKPELNMLLGQSYFNLQNFEKARPYLEAYEQSGEPMSPQAIYQLAYVQYDSGQYADAVQNFEKLNILDDELGQNALYALAQSYLKLGDKEKAKNAFARAAEMDFNPVIKENASFSNAKLSYELGRSNEAITLVKAFVDEFPRSTYRGEADEILVDLFLNSNNYKDALQILESMPNRTQEMDQALQKVAYYRAIELYNNGDLNPTKALFDTVRKYPYDKSLVAKADYWTGELAYEYGRHELAREYITKYLASGSASPADQQYAQANYTVGYSYYNQKDYRNALGYFEKVGSGGSYSTDAALRAADSHFALRNYARALDIYSASASGSGPQADYASFQQAVLQGLNGNNSSKLRNLEKLYTSKPNSQYADDALYEYGRVYTTQENYTQAEQAFQKLISKYPKSEKLKNAYLQLGLINYNKSNYNEALRNYDKVVKGFPSTEESAAALEAMKEIYIETGNPDGYLDYIKGVKNVDLSNAEEEKLLYSAGESQFQSGNCAKAKTGFSNYLNRYPRGLYSANAHFYRGECLSQEGQALEALKDYSAVLDLPESKFTERSVLRVARTHFRQADFENAIRYYKQLESSSANVSGEYNQEIATSLMQAYNRTDNRQDAVGYARQLDGVSGLDTRIRTEADFLKAWAQYTNSNGREGLTEFQRVAAATRNTYGAESRYYIAAILYNQNQYQQSIDAAFKVSDETPSEDFWVAKSFILISDNYYAQGELFQAKATLQSILDNYSNQGDGIREEATRKLNKISGEEKQKSNILNEVPTNQLQLEDDPN